LNAGYALLHATYDWLAAAGNAAASNVALAYVKPDGSFAYNK